MNPSNLVTAACVQPWELGELRCWIASTVRRMVQGVGVGSWILIYNIGIQVFPRKLRTTGPSKPTTVSNTSPNLEPEKIQLDPYRVVIGSSNIMLPKNPNWLSMAGVGPSPS